MMPRSFRNFALLLCATAALAMLSAAGCTLEDGYDIAGTWRWQSGADWAVVTLAKGGAYTYTDGHGDIEVGTWSYDDKNDLLTICLGAECESTTITEVDENTIMLNANGRIYNRQ